MAHSISLDLYNFNFTGLSGFAETIHGGFIKHAADYGSPNPSMIVFGNDINKFKGAISAWGVVGNRGSHKDYLDLLAARNIIRNDLRLLKLHAQNKRPGDIISWTEVGFKISRPKSKPQPLPMVQNFRHLITRSVPAPGIKLKWKKPLDTDRRAVKGYVIQRNNTSEYPLPAKGNTIINMIGLKTSTDFIDPNPFPGENWYWVTPFNTLGFGVTSEALLVVSNRIR